MRALRVFSKDQKDRVVRRIEAGETVRSVSEGTGILRNSLSQWLDAHRRMGPGWLEVKRGRKQSAGDFGARASAGLRPPPSTRPPRAPLTIRRRRQRSGSQSWSAWSAVSRSNWIFFKKPCGHGTRRAEAAARPSLRRRRNDDPARIARRNARRNDSAGCDGCASVRQRRPLAGQRLSRA